jgi:cell division protein FtsN
MAGDFRRGAAKATPRRTRSRSCVWWYLFGCLTGAFGVGLYWMSQGSGQLPPQIAAIPKAERPAPQQPHFQFEKILRETVVDSTDTGKPPPPPAPRPEPPPPPPAPATATPAVPPADAPKPEQAKPEKAKPPGTETYLLQVGSFKTPKEAEAMKAQMAMLGVSTRVQAVHLKDGKVWHRVTTGKLDSKKAMEQARAKLTKQGRDSIVIKLKPAVAAETRAPAHKPADRTP